MSLGGSMSLRRSEGELPGMCGSTGSIAGAQAHNQYFEISTEVRLGMLVEALRGISPRPLPPSEAGRIRKHQPDRDPSV
jgi:hypothetical protein